MIKIHPQRTMIAVGFLVGMLAYWFNAYNEHEVKGVNIYFLLAALTLFAAYTLGSQITSCTLRMPLRLTIGILIAAVFRIVFDLILDSSSHNLFPLELLILVIVSIPMGYAGFWLSRKFKPQK